MKEELKKIGENLLNNVFPEWKYKEDMRKTPERFAKMIETWFTPQEFEFTTFSWLNPTQLVLVENITFLSFCSHHLAPIFGEAIVGYFPNKKIAGLSKIPRLIKERAKKPITQEEFANEIIKKLDILLNPKAVFLKMRAEHTCMTQRGVKQEGGKMESFIYKVNDQNPRYLNEFLSITKNF